MLLLKYLIFSPFYKLIKFIKCFNYYRKIIIRNYMCNIQKYIIKAKILLNYAATVLLQTLEK